MSKTWMGIIVATIIVIGGVIFLLAQSGDQLTGDSNNQVANETIKLSSKEGMGNFLVDKNGMTLYYFPKDNINKSNCLGQCVTAWPLFYEESVGVKAPLEKGDFGEITRPEDGAKMTTYKGWPLYYYFKDTKAGDTLGEGVGNVWYIVPEPFYTVMTQNKEPLGNYLVDPKGMTFYYFLSDTQGTATVAPKSNCTAGCLTAWPVFYTENVIAPSLLKKTDFTTFTRTDGSKQLVYKGWPLYYYAGDKNPGDTTGQGVNNVWFVVNP